MIRPITPKETDVCAALIRESFETVAKEFGFTPENAPRFTAFATTKQRLDYQLLTEHRPMFAFYENGRMVGYYSLHIQGSACELNNLCAAPDCRHRKIGERLLSHAFAYAKEMGCDKMRIGIVEENKQLRAWYERFGFVHTGTEKFDFFPFTCGYLQKTL